MHHKKQTPWLLIGLAAAAVCLGTVYILRLKKPCSMDMNQQPPTGIDTAALAETAVCAESTGAFEVDQACCIDYIANCSTPCVIKFYAPWCGACNHLATYYDDVAKEFDGKVTFYSINCDNADMMKAAQDAGLPKEPVQYLPTLVFMEKGKVHEQQTGAMSKDDLVAKIKATFAL